MPNNQGKVRGLFQPALSNAQLKLHQMSKRDLQLEKTLESFAEEKDTYAQFLS